MTGKEFIRKLRKLARERGVNVRVKPARGKGSHSVIYWGSIKMTTLPHVKRDMPPAFLRAVCLDLGISEKDLP